MHDIPIYGYCRMIGLLHNRRHIRRITPISPSRNPQGPSTGEWRVLRGGSWDDNPGDLRAAYRDFNFPAGTYCSYGFRCVSGL